MMKPWKWSVRALARKTITSPVLMHMPSGIRFKRTAGPALAGLAMLVLVVVLALGAYMRNSMWYDPIPLWKDAAFKSPSKARPYHELGDVYAKRKDFSSAVYWYQKARAADPSYFNLALSYAMSRDAANPPSRLTRPAGHDSAYLFSKSLSSAEEYVRRGLLDEAIAEYQKMLALNPCQPAVLNSLGLAYYRKGLLREADQQFSKAIASDPGFSAARSNLGFLHFKRGFIDKAVHEFREAIRLDPRDPEPHAKLGLVYMESGLFDESLAELQSALTLDASNAAALSYRERALALKKQSKR